MNHDLISRAALLKEIRLQKSYAGDMRQQTYRTGFIVSLSILEGKIANIPAVDAVPQWISVEERLPEPCEDVLCYEEGNGMEVMSGQWVREQYYEGYYKFYWMPLPEPPEVLEDE